MSYQFSPQAFGFVEPDDDRPIELPHASRAERNVPRASTAHCTVNSVLGNGAGTRFQSESLLEYRHKLIWSVRDDLADMREQARFRYGRDKSQEVIFDFYLTLTDGTRIACDVKPEVRLKSGRHLSKLQEVAWWVREYDFADEVRLLTDADIDPVELFNAQVLSAVRNSDPTADAAAMAVVNRLEGVRSLLDLTSQIGLQARGRNALLRLIRDGILRTLGDVRIKPEALLRRVEQGRGCVSEPPSLKP